MTKAELVAIMAKNAGSSKISAERAMNAMVASIVESLRTRPLPPEDAPDVFGELRFRLPHMKLNVCVGVVRPLTVHFAVSQETQTHKDESFVTVYLVRFLLMG